MKSTTRVAIVTGASSGIGLEITKALLARGDAVVAVARSATKSLEPTERLALVDGDVGEAETARRAVALALERFGGLDLLVNNAGIFIAKPFTDYTAEDYERLISTNMAGFFHMTQHALVAMAERRAGHVVNISTSLASQPIAGVPSALAILIKGGIEAASRGLAIEYAPVGVRVNTVAPGIVDTPMHAAEAHAFLRGLSPAGRIAKASEVADAVLFLDGATFVSGEVVHVDGGAHAGKWAA